MPGCTRHFSWNVPTALNCTSRDIINLWVTRMIFSGLFFMGEAPFSDVIIHATVQAADGRRMSKSLSTGVDRKELIPYYERLGYRVTLIEPSTSAAFKHPIRIVRMAKDL